MKNTFEAYMQQHMCSKLQQLLQEHRLVSLITQLRGERPPGTARTCVRRPDVLLCSDAVFRERGAERSLQDRRSRARQTLEEMLKYLPGQRPRASPRAEAGRLTQTVSFRLAGQMHRKRGELPRNAIGV